VAGTVDASGGVELAPLRTVGSDGRREAAPAAGGAYLLRLAMEDGRTIERRFDVTMLDHAPGVGHFLLRLPHPGGRVAGVEVRAEAAGERRVMATRAARKPAGSAAPAAGPWAEVSQEGSTVLLQWGAADMPYATLKLVVGDQRHVLALDATGGRWRVPAEAWRDLPAGGQFEVSLSDGVESVRLVVPRR
jgi:hypothetical protein